MNLNNRTVILTGASGGIGSALAKALDQQGARLILCGREEGKLKKLAAELTGDQHIIVAADLSDAHERTRLVEIAKQHHACTLINLAGCNDFAFLNQSSERDIERQINMNLMVPIMLCRELSGYLSAQQDSAIVNVGSILGSIGYAGSSIYCASKFGLRGFSEALRREYADTGLKVVYVAPRATDTEMNPREVKQMNAELGTATDSPDYVAKEILRALQHDTKVRYLGWPEKLFVILNSLFPSLVDGALFKQLPTIRTYAQKHLKTHSHSA